jgi:hypothetical protein
MLISHSWVNDLPRFFSSHGLRVLADFAIRKPNQHMPIVAQTTYWGQMKREDPGVEKHWEQLFKEHEAGAMVDLEWICVVGRKLVQSDDGESS